MQFHTQHGYRTGIIEYIKADDTEHDRCPVAVITVRNLHGKVYRYHRKLYKLKSAWPGSTRPS